MPQRPVLPCSDDGSATAADHPGPCIDYHSELNSAQLAAVTHGDGPLLVIAGAGSGKTRTLTYRVARLVEDGTPPETILLLSFTRKASHEMLRRAAGLLDHRCHRVSGGTFHSFANSVLRRHAGAIGFSEGFSIIDRADAEDLIGLIRKEFGTRAESKKLPRKSTLANIFSRSINKELSIEDIIYDDYAHFEHQLGIIETISKIYQQRKREHFFCDYDDLLVYLHQLLSENDAVRQSLSSFYRHILVDEYQDTNLIQAEIIALLAGEHRNVMVVGDDSQSIYAFRGANFKNIISFPERFPGTRVIKLEENYRSLQPILDLTNSVIEEASEKYSKKLFTRRGGGLLPKLVASMGENAQSRYVVEEINRLLKQGVPLDDIAVLFRASFHSFDLELELTRNAIPFVKFGGFRFAESAHVKDILAHLKVLCTPKDRISWYRILLLISKIGPKTAKAIFESIMTQGRGAIGIIDAGPKGKSNLELLRFKNLIDDLVNSSSPLKEKGERILEYYLPILKERYDDHPKRLRDLQQLVTIMERYDRPDTFLADMALEPPNASINGQLATDRENAGKLVLSTVHSAKGLEWHSVFVIWALDGRFPSHHAMDKPEALEEERRLMYVATTRAQENLTITYPTQVYDRITQTVLYNPSRFLERLAYDMVDKDYYNPHG